MQFQKNLYKIIDKEILRPVNCFFIALYNREIFLEGINNITKGYSEAFEGVISCFFPRDLDEGTVFNFGFNGVNFECFEDSITIDVPTFRKYLRMACEAYWAEYPESRRILEEYLSRPQPPLEEGALPLWKEMRDAGKFPKPYSEFE